MTDVDLSLNETFHWIFSGLNVNVSQCSIDSLGIVVQSNTDLIKENVEIMIHNSSFGGLDLRPDSKALITESYIDGQFKPRSTLITANISSISIQNCQFENFVNENGSTILFGHNNSHVVIENSMFIQHNSSKGVLFLQNNSSMHISDSLVSQNVASSLFFSSISLEDGIKAVVNNSVFKNNSALVGGALFAKDECQVTLTNCTFSSNKAITGKIQNIVKNPNLERAPYAIDKNNIRTYVPLKPMFVNHMSSRDKKTEIIAAHQLHLLTKSSNLKKKSAQKNGPSCCIGGAIFVAVQSQLMVTNCVFKDNSAELGGAITTTVNTTLNVQDTNFTCNNAIQGGAIQVDTDWSYLYMTDCSFENNNADDSGGAIAGVSEAFLEIKRSYFSENRAQFAGAIIATSNVTLDAQETVFVGNEAKTDLGAVSVKNQAHLLIKNCVFDDNVSQRYGGAIAGGFNATVVIQYTNFTRNKAMQGGAIDVDQQSDLIVTNCMFEENRARLGGALFGGLDLVCKINGSHFLHNSALHQGGAINIQQEADVLITNSRLA